jgi:coproporphyrinogen III oxidase-like Fe-S oxidoreductase
LMMGLRLTEGLELERLEELAGVRPAPAAIAPLAEDGLLAEEGGRLKAIGHGRFVLNELILQLSDVLSPV